MRSGPVRGLRAIAATFLAVIAAVTYEVATPSTAGADDCVGQVRCTHTDPTDDGWGGDVEAQRAEANRGTGRSGSNPTTPCWAIPEEDHEMGGEIVPRPEDPDDTDPDDEGIVEGVVIWVYNNERNQREQERPNPSEGVYLTRVCSIPGEDGRIHVRHHLNETTCRDVAASGICNAECGQDAAQEFCQYGNATYEFDALAPEPLIEWMIERESFEERVALPEPEFNPTEVNGIDGPATLVNLDTYLWVPGADEDTIATSIEVADIVLELEAHRDEFFVWDMGDGQTPKHCDTPGIDPLVDGLDHPDACIYSYSNSSASQSDDRFHGNVSVDWVGTYTARDEGGAVLFTEEHIVTATEDFELGVAESQAIVIR